MKYLMGTLHSTVDRVEKLRELLLPFAPAEGLRREFDLDSDLGLESHSRAELLEELSELVEGEESLSALFRARTVGELEDILSGIVPIRQNSPKISSPENDPPRSLLHLIYTGWVFTVLFLCFSANWLVNLLLPTERLRRIVTKYSSRFMCSLSGVSVNRVLSSEIPAQGIYVANHTSYIDVPIIYSTLPSNFCFVAKIELSRIPLVGMFFKRLGTQFIDRFDAKEARAGLIHMEEILRSGDSLFFFPEGTFRATPGVLHFRAGAFLLAERFQLPLIPVSLRGTREVYRDARGWIRRVPITITVHNPIPFDPNIPPKTQKEVLRRIIANGAQEPLLD